jgi:hypothetical protein
MKVNCCPVREPCWRDLNSRAIEAGRAKPERPFPCGFETCGTVEKCGRRTRYNAPQSEFIQLTIDLSCGDQNAA